MAHLVLADEPLPAEILTMLGSEYDVQVWGEGDLDTLLGAAEGIYTYGHAPVGAALIERAPNLKVISNYGVGVDHIDLDAARRRSIPVGNTPHVLDGATADMTFALLLAAARKVTIGDRYARDPTFTHYDPGFMLGTEVHGATLGIIGMGNIGRQVARRARAFDMTVLYHNRKPNVQAEAELGVTYAALPDLLRRADFVTLNVPLNAETRGMIGAEQLALMKPTAILVNVARGAVIDHQALVEALDAGRIGGAALDVTEPEPLPRDHPLLKMEHVIITPHLGSATRQTRQAMACLSVDNLKAGLAGQQLPARIA